MPSPEFKSATSCVIFLVKISTELLKNIRRIGQGFPHIRVCPWMVPHLVSSCLGLFSAIYVYVISAFYYHAKCDC